MIIVDVQGLVDDLWDWLDFRAQLFLDIHEVETVSVSDEVDGEAEVTKPSGPPYPVQVGLGSLWEVKVDDHIDRLNVNASRQQI